MWASVLPWMRVTPPTPVAPATPMVSAIDCASASDFESALTSRPPPEVMLLAPSSPWPAADRLTVRAVADTVLLIVALACAPVAPRLVPAATPTERTLMACTADAVMARAPPAALADESATSAVTLPPIWLSVSEMPTAMPPPAAAAAAATTSAEMSERSTAVTPRAVPANTDEPPVIEASVRCGVAALALPPPLFIAPAPAPDAAPTEPDTAMAIDRDSIWFADVASTSTRPPVDCRLDASTLARTRLSMVLVAGEAPMATAPPMATAMASAAATFSALMPVSSLALMWMSPVARRPSSGDARPGALDSTRAWVSLVTVLLVTLAAPARETAPMATVMASEAPTASESMRPPEAASTVIVPTLSKPESFTSASVTLSMWLSANAMPKLTATAPMATAAETEAPTALDMIAASLTARTVTLPERSKTLSETVACVVFAIAFCDTAPAAATATAANSDTEAAPAALTDSASILASELAVTRTLPSVPPSREVTLTRSTDARVALPMLLMATDAPTAPPTPA